LDQNIKNKHIEKKVLDKDFFCQKGSEENQVNFQEICAKWVVRKRGRPRQFAKVK
jgi:hypothetical protein